MGLRIGETVATLATRQPSNTRTPRESEAARDPAEPEVNQAGFGQDTLSPAGAALVTVEGTVAGAREIVPTVDEIREEIADRLEVGLGETRPEEETDAPQPEPELFRPEAAAEVRNFAETEEAELALRIGAPRETGETPTPTPAPDNAVTPERLDVLV